jgi:hypothetical protein
MRSRWSSPPAQAVGDPDEPHTYSFIDDFAAGLVTLVFASWLLVLQIGVPSAEKP